MTVYFAMALRTGRIKIGCCRGAPERRVLQHERRRRERLVILTTTPGGRRVESWWHRRHAQAGERHEISGRLTEWFAPSPLLLSDIAELIGVETGQ